MVTRAIIAFLSGLFVLIGTGPVQAETIVVEHVYRWDITAKQDGYPKGLVASEDSVRSMLYGANEYMIAVDSTDADTLTTNPLLYPLGTFADVFGVGGMFGSKASNAEVSIYPDSMGIAVAVGIWNTLADWSNNGTTNDTVAYQFKVEVSDDTDGPWTSFATILDDDAGVVPGDTLVYGWDSNAEEAAWTNAVRRTGTITMASDGNPPAKYYRTIVDGAATTGALSNEHALFPYVRIYLYYNIE